MPSPKPQPCPAMYTRPVFSSSTPSPFVISSYKVQSPLGTIYNHAALLRISPNFTASDFGQQAEISSARTRITRGSPVSLSLLPVAFVKWPKGTTTQWCTNQRRNALRKIPFLPTLARSPSNFSDGEFGGRARAVGMSPFPYRRSACRFFYHLHFPGARRSNVMVASQLVRSARCQDHNALGCRPKIEPH